jgi:NRPS condensation-like uncharacterized protein
MIPETFATSFLDRGMYALAHVGEMVIQLEARFSHRLDAGRLEQSFQLLMDAEPILGCRLDPSGELGCWRRLPLDERPGVVVAEDAAQLDEQRVAPLSVETGPAVRACLLPQEGGDRLLLGAAHHVADAGAVKRIATLLSSIYSRLEREPGYRPAPNIEGDRSLAQVTRLLPWTSRLPILGALIKEGLAQSLGRPCQGLGLEQGARAGLRFLTRTIDEESVASLAELGRRHRATLNDIALTAAFRALAKVTGWDGATRLTLNITADLRRYLPGREAAGICNLSGIEPLTLGRRLEDSFEQTLARVSAKTRARKRSWIGLSVYGSPMMKTLERMSLEKYSQMFTKRFDLMTGKGRVAPPLTNMGVVPAIDIGGTPETCHLLVPPIFPPGSSVGLSGYRGTLTFSTGAYAGTSDRLNEFLDAIWIELESAVR